MHLNLFFFTFCQLRPYKFTVVPTNHIQNKERKLRWDLCGTWEWQHKTDPWLLMHEHQPIDNPVPPFILGTPLPEIYQMQAILEVVWRLAYTHPKASAG